MSKLAIFSQNTAQLRHTFVTATPLCSLWMLRHRGRVAASSWKRKFVRATEKSCIILTDSLPKTT